QRRQAGDHECGEGEERAAAGDRVHGARCEPRRSQQYHLKRAQARRREAPSSSGTDAASLELCSTSEVRTLRTCGAAVRRDTNSWNAFMSGATHFRMKSISPDSIQHSRTNGSSRTKLSNARRSASA